MELALELFNPLSDWFACHCRLPLLWPSYFVATTPKGFYWFMAIDAFSTFRPNLIGHALHRPTLVFPSVTVRGHGDRPTRFRRRSLPFWKGTSAMSKKAKYHNIDYASKITLLGEGVTKSALLEARHEVRQGFAGHHLPRRHFLNPVASRCAIRGSQGINCRSIVGCT
jgi:hypothetical protein